MLHISLTAGQPLFEYPKHFNHRQIFHIKLNWYVGKLVHFCKHTVTDLRFNLLPPQSSLSIPYILYLAFLQGQLWL